jgi:succinate-semialdehyde dehydrogenase/glutarate-semialdehyde dehydrogenase
MMQLKDPSLFRQQAFIAGEWVDADGKGVIQVDDPATRKTLGTVPKMGAAETERAIEAARGAMAAWRRKTAKERSAVVRKWFDLLMANSDDVAAILTAEQGKPLAEAKGEIAYGAAFIEWFSEEAKRVYGETIPGPSPDKRIVCIRQPVGVVACITPWNFPNAMLTRKIGPALAAGCTVVCKPASATPLSALAIAELAERAGIPPGVVNILAGRTGAIGETLTGSPKIRKLTFTGSTETGKALIRACAVNVKRTTMELGGNAPFIVFDDADLDAAVEGAIASKYRNAGQTCVCANRMLVQSDVYEAFSEKLAAAVRELKVGDGFEEGVKIGPLIDVEAANQVLSMVDEAVERGARLVLGGKRAANGEAFVEPAVLTGVNREMRVFNEEIFGPVAPLFRFDTEEEAIEMANDTPFGLASYFYARDMGRIWRVAEGLEYGIVGINAGLISNEMAPFGGMKESGNGREGSRHGIDDYVEIKYLCLGGI